MQQIPFHNIYKGLFDGPHATPKPSDSGPIFLGIKNITEDGQLDLSTKRFISEEEYPKWTKRVIPVPGDIVFSYEATLHRYAVIPEGFRGCLGRRMALIRPDYTKVDKDYLFSYFFSPGWRNEVNKHILSGATVDRIPLTKVPDFEISIHPLPLQKKIGNVLRSYSKLIENNNRRIAILEDMAQSLYREWFVNFRYPNHKENLDADGNPKLVDSPLGQIPEGWEVKPLGELVEFKRKTIKKGSVPGNTPYMGLEHFPRKSIALSDWEEVSEIGSNKLAFFRGDILFGKIRPNFHKVGVAQVDGLCSSDTFVLSPKEIKHHSLIAMVTFSNEFVAQAVQTAQGSKMPRASWDVLQDFSVCIPDPKALECFNSVVTLAIEQIRVLSLKNRNLKQQRDMLLPKLISGQIELKD